MQIKLCDLDMKGSGLDDLHFTYHLHNNGVFACCHGHHCYYMVTKLRKHQMENKSFCEDFYCFVFPWQLGGNWGAGLQKNYLLDIFDDVLLFLSSLVFLKLHILLVFNQSINQSINNGFSR